MINLQGFGGEAPKISPNLLQPGVAQLAQNCELTSGEIRPFFNPLTIANPSLTGDIKTIYYYLNSYLLTWNAVVDVASSPVAGDTRQRLYYTGDGVPKVTSNDLVAVAGHGGIYPTDYHLLGVPRPTGTLTATATGIGGSGIDRDVVYLISFVTAWGEEGAPIATVSNTVTSLSGEQVTIGGLPSVAPTGYDNITTVRLYRSMAGFQYSVWQFVDDIAIGTTTYTDSILDGYLGTPLTTETYDPPDPTMLGLVSHPSGSLVGFFGNTVAFSQPYYPHAWPSAYQYAVPHPIVGLGVYGDSIVVLTEVYPYTFSGADPSQMRRTKFPDRQPCLTRRGIVSYAGGVLYPSPDGLYLISGETTGQLVTQDILSKANWYAYNLAESHAVILDQKYHGFYKTGVVDGVTQGRAFVVNLSEPSMKLTELDVYCLGAFILQGDDVMWMSRNVGGGNVVQRWGSDFTRLLFTWRSGKFEQWLKNPGLAQVVVDTSMGVTAQQMADISAQQAVVIAANAALIASDADGGDIGDDAFGELEMAGSWLADAPLGIGDENFLVFRLYADGALVHEQAVQDSEPFTLPSGYLGRQFEVEVYGNMPVKRIAVAGSMDELAQAVGG